MKIVDKYAALISLTQRCEILSWEGSRRFVGEVILSEDLKHYLSVLDQSQLVTDTLVEGKRPSMSEDFLCDALGKKITVTIELPAPKNDYVIVRNFEDMLKCEQFISEMPDEYYDIEKKTSSLPQEYKEAVKFGTLLNTISDHVEKNGNKRVCFLYSGAKLRIPISFSAQDLCLLPKLEEFLEKFNVPQHTEKINFFKAAIVKIGMGAQTETQTFAHLLKNFSVIQNTFESDFNVYLADFSLEKILGEIEEKTMKLADKVAASLSDLQKTMITIPLAIIFATPRIDQNGWQTWTNSLILLSVWIFALFTWVFFSSQKRNLHFIISEIEEQKKSIQEMHAPLAKKLLPKFKILEKRCADQTRYRCIIGSLMWLTVVLLTIAFIYPSLLQYLFSCLSAK